MSRVQDIALGAGICTVLVALVACAVQMVLEVLAVERDRRKDAGRGQSGARPDATAPPPGVALSDDVFAQTVRRAHPDLTEWPS